MTAISLCMIVRDEAASLARCLRSVVGVCDELCVVDTGSRDESPRIAASFGARVVLREWTNDFAAARNASLALARGDWVLVLDADEELDLAGPSPRAALLEFASRGARLGRVRVENRLDDGERTEVALTRFFPNHPLVRFSGRIHEQVARSDGAALARADTGVRLVHHGYAREALAAKGKLARNVALLELELAERPADGYLWYQLGRTHARAGRQTSALAALERALELSCEADAWPVHALELGAEALRALGRSQQALELVRAALPLVPGRADTRFLAGLLALDLGDAAEAERGFRACLELGLDEATGAESSPAASSWAALHNLGVICELSGRPAEARALYRRALAVRPGHAASAAGLARLDAAPVPTGPAAPDALQPRAPTRP